MSQLVKMKRQANIKGFERFGAFKGLVEQKNVVFNSFVCKLGLLWHSWPKKGSIYTQTRQINYYFRAQSNISAVPKQQGTILFSENGLIIQKQYKGF
jgi:hypothetical protein